MKSKRQILTTIFKLGVALVLIALILTIRTALDAKDVRAKPLALDLNWYVIGGGGGHSALNPYVLDGTVGQPVVGTVTMAGPYDECVGFWCWGWNFERKSVYLPLVMRDAP